jgi:F-type H+-transporting ATPase subunit b
MLQFEPGLAIWTIVTFLILFIALWRLVWPKILLTLEEREESIKTALSEAKNAQVEAEQKFEETKEMLNKARKEAQDIIKQGAKRAETVREELIKKASEEARSIVEKTKIELEREREKAISELKERAVNLSVAIAAKIISSSLTAEQQADLAKQAIKDLESKI